jgi:GAF domain-containing protein
LNPRGTFQHLRDFQSRSLDRSDTSPWWSVPSVTATPCHRSYDHDLSVDDHPASPRAGEPDEIALRQLEDAYVGVEQLPIDVAAMAVAPQLDGLGADAAFIGAVSADRRTVQVARVTPWSANPVRLAFPVDSAYPLAATLRSGQSLFVASNEQLSCDHPGLVRVKDEDHACATIPLFAPTGELVGALNVGFAEPHEFTDDERTTIGNMAEECAALLTGSRR